MYSAANSTYILDLQLLTVVCTLHLPAVKLVGVFLSGIMEVQTQICVNSYSKVVIHYKDLCVIFICRASCNQKKTALSYQFVHYKHPNKIFQLLWREAFYLPITTTFQDVSSVLTKSEWREVSQVIQLSTEYQLYRSSLMQAQFLLHHTICSVKMIHATGSICCQE